MLKANGVAKPSAIPPIPITLSIADEDRELQLVYSRFGHSIYRDKSAAAGVLGLTPMTESHSAFFLAAMLYAECWKLHRGEFATWLTFDNVLEATSSLFVLPGGDDEKSVRQREMLNARRRVVEDAVLRAFRRGMTGRDEPADTSGDAVEGRANPPEARAGNGEQTLENKPSPSSDSDSASTNSGS